jgi:hypothetical protein
MFFSKNWIPSALSFWAAASGAIASKTMEARRFMVVSIRGVFGGGVGTGDSPAFLLFDRRALGLLGLALAFVGVTPAALSLPLAFGEPAAHHLDKGLLLGLVDEAVAVAVDLVEALLHPIRCLFLADLAVTVAVELGEVRGEAATLGSFAIASGLSWALGAIGAAWAAALRASGGSFDLLGIDFAVLVAIEPAQRDDGHIDLALVEFAIAVEVENREQRAAVSAFSRRWAGAAAV